MYGTVDHPFHASRGASVLDALQHFDLVRWMDSHQAGYPVEFYPLGVAWMDVTVWAGLFGQVPILAVHKLVVGLIFVLPAVAFWLLVRGDNIHPSAAFLAMSMHIAVPGYWLNGGYEELVGWGLVTNVTGATFAVISTILLARYVIYRHHWCGVSAVLTIAIGTMSNPRSLFGVVLAGIAIAFWYLTTNQGLALKKRFVDLVGSMGAVATLAFLISAPVVMSLLRYSDQYFFLHYQFYQPISMFWDALKQALTFPVLILSLASGSALLLIVRLDRLRVSQILTLTVIAYSLFTIWVARNGSPPPLIEQLEAPRLMPFQRQLMIAIAAVGVVALLRGVTQRLSWAWREGVLAVLVIGASLFGIRHMANESRDVAANEIAMYEVGTVGDKRFADLEDAVAAANAARPQGSAVFVVGNQQEWWHEQLWAPGIEQGTYYYDDWLWYWHGAQSGPYDPIRGYYMDNPADAFNGEYFSTHGIGVVMVSDMWVPSGTPPRMAASQSPLLNYVGTWGAWDVYTVSRPGTLVTRGDDSPIITDMRNGQIQATFQSGSGDVIVRQNWFPRWQATVNGETVDVERADNGYMRIPVPDGPAVVTLTYGVTTVDWIARAASVAGVAGTLVFAATGSRFRSLPKKEESDAATRSVQQSVVG